MLLPKYESHRITCEGKCAESKAEMTAFSPERKSYDTSGQQALAMDTIAILLNVSNNSFGEVENHPDSFQFSRRRPSPLSPPPSEKEGGAIC